MGNIPYIVQNCCPSDSSKKPTLKIVATLDTNINPIKKMKHSDPQLEDETRMTINRNIQEYINVKPKYKKKISVQDFNMEGILGQGGFGIVFQVQLKQNIDKKIAQKYALKRVNKSLLIQKKLLQNAILQKNILATFQCKFIVALIMAFQDPNYVYFVMQFATGGDTYSLINKKTYKVTQFKSLGQSAIRFIAGCVILGLKYLHQNKIIYRDLKPENVLMFQNGYVKITDFGLAKKTQPDHVSNTITGTVFYYAPEMILKKGYNSMIDFWTLGVYLYELSVMEPPFNKNQIDRYRFQKACLDAQKSRNWRNALLSQELKGLIDGLLKLDPKKRLGFRGWEQVKGHQFFRDFDWQGLENQSMPSPLKELIDKYPLKPKSMRPQVLRQIQNKQINVQGWTLIKQSQKVIR